MGATPRKQPVWRRRYGSHHQKTTNSQVNNFGHYFENGAGEITSEVGGQAFQGPKMTHSKKGIIIGFGPLFFEKGPI